jgi:hypothetical protein
MLMPRLELAWRGSIVLTTPMLAQGSIVLTILALAWRERRLTVLMPWLQLVLRASQTYRAATRALALA